MYLIPFSRYKCIFLENNLFSAPHPCLTSLSGGTPCNINTVYTSRESTCSGLRFCSGYYGSIFIRVAIVV